MWNGRYDDKKYPTLFYHHFLSQIENSQDDGEIFDFLSELVDWKFGKIREGGDANFRVKVYGLSYVGLEKNSEFRKHRTNMDFLSQCKRFKNGLVSGFEFFRCITETNKIFPSSRLVMPVFVIHVLRPKEYPIIDQHVWRAMNILTRSPAGIDERPASWEDYQKYMAFFDNIVKSIDGPEHTRFDRSVVDRALWAFGRGIKNAQKCEFCTRLSDNFVRCSFCSKYVCETCAAEHSGLCPSCANIRRMDIAGLYNRYLEDCYYGGLIPKNEDASDMDDYSSDVDEEQVTDEEDGEDEQVDEGEDALPEGYEDILHPENEEHHYTEEDE
jgi:hypothetical protein